MPTTFERQNGALSRPSAAQDFTTCSNYERSPIAQTGRARAPRAPQTKSASATKSVGREPRARRKQATTQPTSAVQTQTLPWPTLPAASAPSCDSRHRLASCTNPQARIPPRWSSPSRPRLRHNTADDVSVDIMLGEEGGQGRITLTW